MGLETVLEVLIEAQALVLGDKPLPDETVQWDLFPDSLTEEELELASSKLDEALKPIEKRFYPLDSLIYEALGSFADTRSLKPIDPS